MNKTELEKRKKELEQAWQWVMSANQGRMVVADILRLSGLEQSPFTGATNATIKNIGMQDVGRLVRDKVMTHAFDNYVKMQREEFGNG